MGHFSRTMCLNTDYRNHMLAMLPEVLTADPVDGLFPDCIDLAPCFGVECLAAMRNRLGDGGDWSPPASTLEICSPALSRNNAASLLFPVDEPALRAI